MNAGEFPIKKVAADCDEHSTERVSAQRGLGADAAGAPSEVGIQVSPCRHLTWALVAGIERIACRKSQVNAGVSRIDEQGVDNQARRVSKQVSVVNFMCMTGRRRSPLRSAQKLRFREPWDQVVVGDFSGPVRLKLASDGNTEKVPRSTQHVSLQFERAPRSWWLVSGDDANRSRRKQTGSRGIKDAIISQGVTVRRAHLGTWLSRS